MEQRSGNNEIQNAVTQEFQALVIRRPKAPVRQCCLEQCLIGEYVAEFPGDDDHQASASQSDESSEQGDAVTEQADDDDATRVQPAASGGSKRR